MVDAREPDIGWIRDAQVYVEAGAVERVSEPIRPLRVVLQVHPLDTPFLIGWRPHDPSVPAEFYAKAAQTNPLGQLTMGLGKEGVWFVVRPLVFRAPFVLEEIERIQDDDPRYADTPGY